MGCGKVFLRLRYDFRVLAGHIRLFRRIDPQVVYCHWTLQIPMQVQLHRLPVAKANGTFPALLVEFPIQVVMLRLPVRFASQFRN